MTITKQDLEKFAADKYPKDIARQFNVSVAVVKQWAKKWDITLRPDWKHFEELTCKGCSKIIHNKRKGQVYCKPDCKRAFLKRKAHGTGLGYVYYKCRCIKCIKANSIRIKDYRKRQTVEEME